ncbi:MAG TPA: VanZ family protein [Pyrinomonadaceae bacterium]|jgi:VanZ family protein
MLIKNSTQNIWRGRIIRYAPLILWVAVIFAASSTAGATQNTSMIIRPLLEWLFPDAASATLDAYHGYIRKLAHFTEYGALGFFASRAFFYSSKMNLRKFWFVWAFLFVAFVATADEYNQSFNAARTGSVYDSLIDIAGGLTVIVVFSVVMKIKKAHR